MLDAARSSMLIIPKTCSVCLSDFLLKLMVSAFRSVLNGISGGAKLLCSFLTLLHTPRQTWLPDHTVVECNSLLQLCTVGLAPVSAAGTGGMRNRIW